MELLKALKTRIPKTRESFYSPNSPSKEAISRVTHPLPIPKKCNICEQETVSCIHNEEIYGSSYGKYPWMYYCHNCTAHVGLHTDTAIPLGTLADKETRGLRIKAKNKFYKFSEEHKKLRQSKSNRYAWLAEQLNIPTHYCHFAWFDAKQCTYVIELLDTYTTQLLLGIKFNDLQM